MNEQSQMENDTEANSKKEFALKTIKHLKEMINDSNTDYNKLLETMDVLIDLQDHLEPRDMLDLCIDQEISQILGKNKTPEIIERVGSMLGYIRQPKSIYVELVACLENSGTVVPAIMLIYLLQKETDFYFNGFDDVLMSIMTPETLCSDGFLFFILQVIQQNVVSRKCTSSTMSIVNELIECSIKYIRSTGVLVKVLYVILVALRMQPSLFLEVKLSDLDILRASIGTVRELVIRIFQEARNPNMRPKSVFLNNFSFPEM